MSKKLIASLAVAGLFAVPSFSQAALVINEIDPDQTGTDSAEFVEIFNPDATATSLTNYSLVFFNGSNDLSYLTVSLTGSIAAGGYVIVGDTGVTGLDFTITANTFQNGQDAVALYSSGSFPNGTASTTSNLVDAILYGGADPELTTGLGVQNSGNDGTTTSLQRFPNGTGSFSSAAPTPDAVNVPEPASLSLLGLGGLALLRRKRS